jgi:hypothetical protein
MTFQLINIQQFRSQRLLIDLQCRTVRAKTVSGPGNKTTPTSFELRQLHMQHPASAVTKKKADVSEPWRIP